MISTEATILTLSQLQSSSHLALTVMYGLADNPTSTPSLYELPSCIVCMEKLEKDLSFLRCGHVFHEDCILNCVNLHNKECPMCKKRIQSQKDIGKLYMDFQANNTTQQHIQKILADLTTEDASGSAFNKVIVKLRKALSDQENLSEKLKQNQQENKTLRKDHEDMLKGSKLMQDQLKQSQKLMRGLKRDIQMSNICNSLLEGEKETHDLKIKQLEAQLQEFRMYKKTQIDIHKDGRHYSQLRDQYMISDPTEGLNYFCTLSEGLKLDVKRLQKNISNLEGVVKDAESKTFKYKNQAQDCKARMNKQGQISKLYKEKYNRVLEKARQLSEKLKEKKIECNIVIDENSNLPWQNKQSEEQVPAMLVRKSMMIEVPREEEKNPFFQIGTGQRRLHNKKATVGSLQLGSRPSFF